MNLSLKELEAVVRELERDLVSGQIQEFRQPSESAVWMAVRSRGKSTSVLFETARQRARIHLVDARSTTLTPPPAFVSHLRAHLVNSRVIAVDMPWPDRIVVVRCQRQDVQLSLVLECSSHHPNLFITDWEGSIQLALRPSDSKRRALQPGQVYEPPPLGPGGSGSTDRVGDALSPSAALAAHFSAAEAVEAREQFRRHRIQILRKEVRRTERALAKVRQDLVRAGEWESHQRRGELLKANFALLRPGTVVADVVDYWDPEQQVVCVKLDPARSPQDNVERCFKMARKGKRGAVVAETRLRELEKAVHSLGALLSDIEQAPDVAALELLDEALSKVSPRVRRALEPRASRGRRSRAEPRLPYREFLAQTGRPIRVGRGAKDNHSLTFQHAAPHDVWLHVRGFSGSHVVVPLARGQEPDRETLLEAAYLAIHYSQAPDDGFNEVIWTRRKYVHAVKKGAPGQVIAQQEKNLAVEANQVRLAAILRRRER